MIPLDFILQPKHKLNTIFIMPEVIWLITLTLSKRQMDSVLPSPKLFVRWISSQFNPHSALCFRKDLVDDKCVFFCTAKSHQSTVQCLTVRFSLEEVKHLREVLVTRCIESFPFWISTTNCEINGKNENKTKENSFHYDYHQDHSRGYSLSTSKQRETSNMYIVIHRTAN